MVVEECTNAFTDNIEFALRLISNELTKINRYAKGLPWEYTVQVKHALTFEAAVWAARSVESMIKQRTANKSEVGKKRKSERPLKPNKNNRFSKPTPDINKPKVSKEVT